MLRILRAFAWMRWRVVINTLELTSGSDALQRLSLAVEQILPFIAAALFVPAALGVAALAGYAGVALASVAESPIPAEVLRYLMLAAVLLTIVGPVILPASERTSAVRLLLLPIPRRVLYVAQSASALSDPWILLAVPIVIALPIGLAIGGAWPAALAGLVAGVLFVVVLLGISALMTTVIYLLVRDRQRGELLALLFIVVLPVVAMVPGLMHGSERRADRADQRPSQSESVPSWVRRAGAGVFAVSPSELYRASVLEARDRGAAAARPLAAMIVTAVTLHGLGLLAFGCVLDSPGASRARRSARSGPSRAIVLPGVSRGASAVAIAQIRLGLRSPRGRSILLSPLAVFVMFALLMRRGGGEMEFGFIDLHGGLALAVFATAICLLSILPFAMNQFAIDRSGLTLELLSPLSDLDILVGKAIANGAIAGLPALVCVALAYALFPSGSPALWLCIPLGALAAYALAAPAAAALSAVFPRAVDLNSIGRGSNAHGVAGLVGMAVFLLSAAPPVLLALTASAILNRPTAAPLFLIVWCAIALVISRLLFIPVVALFNRRRENLGLVV